MAATKKATLAAALLLVVQAGGNLARPFAQRFPDDVLREVTRPFGLVELAKWEG